MAWTPALDAAYHSETVAKLRDLLSGEGRVYEPEEFGLYLAHRNDKWDGKSVLEMIVDGRDDECVREAEQLIEATHV